MFYLKNLFEFSDLHLCLLSNKNNLPAPLLGTERKIGLGRCIVIFFHGYDDTEYTLEVTVSNLDDTASRHRKESKLRGVIGLNSGWLRPSSITWGWGRAPLDVFHILIASRSEFPIHAWVPWVEQGVSLGWEVKATSKTCSLIRKWVPRDFEYHFLHSVESRANPQNTHLWTESQNGPSWLSWPRICGWALFPIRRLAPHIISTLGLASTEGVRSPYFCPAALCMIGHALLLCTLSLNPSSSPSLQPLLLGNRSGSQDSWNLTSHSAIFNFCVHHSWGLGPYNTGAPTATVSSSLRMQAKNQCPCLEWRGRGRGEAESFLNLVVCPALLTAACSETIWQFIKCDIHVWGTLLWACFIPW